ncbi:MULTISPECIES: ABC transporter ATP-binding protein [unclassified Paenibacillus]|uniref:ABC transporter ATP-binding protein n=1 Tax=unclassified Paenibacillus TaxID=185978 RepID=UPI001C11D526|nr:MULTISPECIES: ABC transporter ATP-binding protein [unclassified Paenibacillus]MBU5442327.1 ABC transporter ATP-binding protein/permease [Paenibacillus sp. MSJ-34]CAH0119902.1 putative multidrug resistance ABC transporter ATP-binding/permease protein YheH [Paenibacillus sp. CECT 9249]
MNVGKKLFQYALIYKKTFIIALLMLAVAVAAELMGPFIAKTMIDNHVVGIEKPWVEVPAAGKGTVRYDDRLFERSDRVQGAAGQEVRVLQVGRTFVFVDGPISFDGDRKLDGTRLTITQGDLTATYEAAPLATAELFQFYEPEIGGLLKLAGIYIGLILVAAAFEYGRIYLLQSSANRVIQKMRQDVYGQIHRLPIGYFDTLPAGKVVSRVTNDTEAVKDLFVTVLANFFSGAVYMIGIFIALFLLDVRLAVVCLAVVPILALWIVVYRKFATKYNHVIRARLSDINGMLNESIQGMPIIRAFRRQQETKREFEDLNEDHFKYQNKMLNLNSLTSHNLVNVIRNLSLAAVVWYFGGASFSAAGAISFGVIYAFIDYLGRLFQPIVGMVNQLAQLEQALVSAERVFELMDMPGTDVAEGKLPRYKGDVAFDDVSFAYKEEEYVLKHISFEAKQGQTVALVGHTGSGKSSIMNLLFRFYDAQQGKITIDGTDIRQIPKQLLRQHMGIVLQDPFLFTGTIASNVSLDDPSISREQVEKALRDVGAERVFSSLRKGYDEPVIEKGSTLSAGQRQIISFARALAFNPAILILDEATANIDTETEAIIQSALDVVKKGRTTFIIAHRLSTIRSADLILVLHRGEIVEQGSHESLMKLQGRYYQMYQLQQGGKAETVPSAANPSFV